AVVADHLRDAAGGVKRVLVGGHRGRAAFVHQVGQAVEAVVGKRAVDHLVRPGQVGEAADRRQLIDFVVAEVHALVLDAGPGLGDLRHAVEGVRRVGVGQVRLAVDGVGHGQGVAGRVVGVGEHDVRDARPAAVVHRGDLVAVGVGVRQRADIIGHRAEVAVVVVTVVDHVVGGPGGAGPGFGQRLVKLVVGQRDLPAVAVGLVDHVVHRIVLDGDGLAQGVFLAGQPVTA